MPGSNDIPPLRLAPPDSPEELAHRFDREKRAVTRQREGNLENSLAPFRVGSVPYLNALPLTRGIDDQVLFCTPARLAELLKADQLDAAMVSITEMLCSDRYDILDGIAIAALGEVQSVFLAHRRPLDELDVVYCHTASLASVSLLRVLLAERGLSPRFEPLPDPARVDDVDAALLIGDPALDYLVKVQEGKHSIWDLGSAWYELTRLPFVYAAWALRRGADNGRLRRLLREARDFGLDTLDYLIGERTEYTYDFRKDYLSWHIQYHLGADEKRGIARFMQLLEKHGLGPVYEPRFVS